LRVIARAPISYDVLSGGVTHAPLIIASIGGLPPARYVLDTGSDVHLLNEDLADELGQEKRPGEEGTDHSGATMPSWEVDDVPLAVGDLTVVLRSPVAIPAPPPFPGHGIRGILSPQSLHPTAVAVIDMAANELLLVEGWDYEVWAFLLARSPELEVLTLDRQPDRVVVIHAAIEPFPEVPTLVDTGGKRTEFAAAAVPGLAARDQVDLGGGVSGNRFVGRLAGAQTLVAGGARLAVPELAIRSADIHPQPGLVGMDVLRGTVVACAADTSRPVFWQVPKWRDST
jgi:hypothetical protein